MGTIQKFKRLKNPLIKKFRNSQLRPLQTDNRYHSPELSETDDENDKRKIVIYDLKWRSSAVNLN